VALVRTDVSEERIASIITVTRNGEQLAVPSKPILATLMMEAKRSSETSIHTRATMGHTPEDDILHSHHRENFIVYMNIK
jgi:hypothetical protein